MRGLELGVVPVRRGGSTPARLQAGDNLPELLAEAHNGFECVRAMHQADKGGYGPLGEILARAMIDNLNRFIHSQRLGTGQARAVGGPGGR